MDDPLISVIVPVYKAQAYLEECLASILAQTYSNLEIILVEDGSPDNCPAICDAYSKKHSYITVIHKKNGGVSSARNAGLDVATGDYVAFVDADDRLAPDMYQILYLQLVKQQASFCACNFYMWRESGTYENQLPKDCLTESCVPAQDAYPYLFSRGSYECYSCNKLFVRTLFEGVEALRFDERFSICEDRLFIAQLLLRATTVAFTSFTGYYYRLWKTPSQSSCRRSAHANNLAARKQVLNYLPLEHASYDRAVYLNLLAHCTRDAYAARKTSPYPELQKELSTIVREFAPDYRAHKSYFSLSDHLFIRLVGLHSPAACALYCLLRKFYRGKR